MFRSNLKAVIRNLEDYQDGLPAAVQRAIAPDARWRAFLQNAAQRTLAGLAAGVDDDARALELGAAIPGIVDSLVGKVAGNNTVFRMWLARASAAAAGFPVDVERARQFALGGGDQAGEFVSAQENLDAVKQAVQQWVYEEKRLDEYEHADPDEAVEAMMEILGFQPNAASKFTGTSIYSAEMSAAAAEIAPHIQTFINEARGDARSTGGLDAATARQWAQAVLLTWRELVPSELFHRLRHELNALRRQVQRGELKLA